jgi:hypothetical protein
LSISLTIFSFVRHLVAFKLHFTLSFAASTSGRYTVRLDQKLPSLLIEATPFFGPFWKQLVSSLSRRNSAQLNVSYSPCFEFERETSSNTAWSSDAKDRANLTVQKQSVTINRAVFPRFSLGNTA